jgi:hypothetical protein
MLRFEDLRVRDQQELDRDFFNRRFRPIAETIGQLGQEVASVTGETDRLVALGLTRVNEVLGLLLARVQAVSENGFLVATSATELTRPAVDARHHRCSAARSLPADALCSAHATGGGKTGRLCRAARRRL